MKKLIFQLSQEEKEHYINILTEHLQILRMRARISRDLLSSFIGISRQTYGLIEKGEKKMTWYTYLTLIFFYENLEETRKYLHQQNIYPEELVEKINKR